MIGLTDIQLTIGLVLKGDCSSMINSILMIQQPAVSVLIIGTTKRFYTRGTLRGMRISRFAKIPTVYRDCQRALN
jgi:hypothetical protein